jgi:hypothetical protein
MDLRIVGTVAKRLLTIFVVATCSLILTLAPLGCKAASMTNTVVSRADNPNGRSSALLVERYRHAALSSNQFYLLVLPKEQNIDKAVNREDIEDSSALVATLAGKVQLRWQGNDTLLVVCDSCGLEAIDISKKLDHIGTTKIVYHGFPEHTAYS